MALSNSLEPTRSLRLRRVESLESASAIRHVDELDEGTLATFTDALESGRSVSANELGLEPGTVVVFTDYVRVVEE